MNTAMILAAGRGERLRPLTDVIPKALCRIDGVPLIERHVRNLVQAGFERIVINHAHLGGQIRQYLGNGERWGAELLYSPEPPGGLETGGGIVQALPLLGKQPFLTVNADIYTDYDFKLLKNKETQYIHLVVVPKNPEQGHFGDFGLLNQSQLCNEPKEFTYPGIACYNPQVFKGYRAGRYSVVPLLREFTAQRKVSAELYHGLWCDIGTLERLSSAAGTATARGTASASAL
jgi:MurNAc alpha-1-phosphate uridylyltransferase